MNEACERFIEDPEGQREHAAGCADCAALLRDLDRLDSVLIDTHPGESHLAARVTSHLPVAPWEGATYRSWRIVLGALAVLTLSLASAFVLAGISPLVGFLEAVRSSLLPSLGLARFAPRLPELLETAPLSIRFGIVASFLIVNAALFILLRRLPRGYDATRR